MKGGFMMPSPVYVNDDWTGLPPGTVVGPGQVIGTNAFATIEDGYTAVDSPGTVIVYPGLYEPAATIVISKNGVTFSGPQANVDPRPAFLSTRTPGSTDEAIVDGRGILGTIFRISANDITINGFEIRNGLSDLIDSPGVLPDKLNPTLSYSIIHQAGDEGTQLRNTVNAVVEYNYVFDTTGDAINICCDSRDGFIQYNEVNDNSSINAAIYVYNADNITIQWNLVQNVLVNDGIKLGSSSAPFDVNRFVGRVLNNVVRDLEQDGITVISRDAVVDGNDVYRSRSTNGAVFVDRNLTNIQITNNCIHDNGVLGDGRETYGVRIGALNNISTNVQVNQNNIFNNIDGGLIFNPIPPQPPPGPLDAENNWWGSPNGPNTMAGQSDSVVGNVDYIPFLTEPGPTCLSQPAITSTNEIIVDNDPGECSAFVSYTISASSSFFPINELTSAGETYTFSPPQDDVTVEEEGVFPVGTTNIPITVTNIDGQTDTITLAITVRDTESPTIICPEDKVVFIETDEAGTVVTYPEPVVSDNCPVVACFCTPASGSFFPVGSTEVTCTAEDIAGRVTTCMFTVTVEQAPPNTLSLNLWLTLNVQVVSDVVLEIQSQPLNNDVSAIPLPNHDIRECINVERVYDWVVFCREINRNFPVSAECNLAIVECENAGQEITIVCEPDPEATIITVLDFLRPFPDRPGVEIVPIRFQIPVQIQYSCNGEQICAFDITVCYVETFVLCYPEGTEIQASVTDVQCFVCRG
ncbi:HYR domain-containing protein [Halobacillus litoralis]|uniref:HYR domain-containing protein n=1 Tax=Halobacillus litoralis TaxID=45668 RepID=A0A845F9W1_9BACI|nr:HYR domain-containing protein [Halobacillus litoralis]MYL70427.1 HYR domain-containing protein [Halobacillus litoralis]